MTNCLLEFVDVVKHYPGGVRPLDGVSMCVQAGQIVSVAGQTGSGKTTLTNLAAGFAHPDTGTVMFDRRDLASLSPRDITMYHRREVGVVEQSFYLRPGVSAVDNVVLKLLADRMPSDEATGRAVAILRKVGLSHRLEHPPERMSGGERHRVALARALVNEPRLIIADEPTAHLDVQTRDQILELLGALAHQGDVAVLMSTNDPYVAAAGDRRYVLGDGRLYNATEPLPDPAPDVTAC